MDVTPRLAADRQVVQAYGGGGFRISQVRHEGGVIVFPDRVLAWPVRSMAELTVESLAAVKDSGAELLLIGCGRSMVAAPPALRQAVRAWGVVIDAMDTGAACRTYNVLLTEERRVAAALIPVD
jgi:uncharacterized protein